MSIQTQMTPDFSSTAICDWLNRLDFSIYSEPYADAQLLQDGYRYSQLDKLLPVVAQPVTLESPDAPQGPLQLNTSSDELVLATYCSQTFEVYKHRPPGTLVATIDVADVVEHYVRVGIEARLYLRNNLTQNVIQDITAAFRSFDVASNSDWILDEAALWARGIDPDDYQVILTFNLTRTKAPIVHSTNRQAFVSQAAATYDGVQEFYVPQSDIVGNFVCSAPAMDLGSPLEAASLEDEDDIANLLEDEFNESPERKTCEEVGFQDKKIGTAFKILEFMIAPIWITITVRVGKRSCATIKTKIPWLHTRESKMVLYGYTITERRFWEGTKDKIGECMQEAAIETAALVVVSGGLGIKAAAAAFAAATQDCLLGFLGGSIACLYSYLRLIKEPGDWRAVGR